MIIKYFADDGTEFETEGECQLYEEGLLHGKMPLMWDKSEFSVSLQDFIRGNISIGDVAFVLFRSKDEYDNFQYWSNYYGYDSPKFYAERAQYPKRFYYEEWDGYNGNWCDVDEEIKRLQEIRTLFEKRA